MRLGEIVRVQRKARGFTLKTLAEKTGLSLAYLSDIERGRTEPSLKTVRKLADALNIEPEMLLAGIQQAQKFVPDSLVEFAQARSLSADWVALLSHIHIRGKYPKDWLEIYLHIRTLLGEG